MKKLINPTATLLLILYAMSLQAQPDATIFDRFPWLVEAEIINPDACTSETIEVYTQGIFTYLLVTDQEGTSTLYNQDGVFYCQNQTNYDCVDIFNLQGPIDTWSCGGMVCEVNDELIGRLLPPFDSDGCVVPIRIAQFNFEGQTYFRTYYGPTRATLTRDQFPCPAQEFFGDIRDCNGTELCLFGLVGPPVDPPPAVCDFYQTGFFQEIDIWSNPDATCPDIDPFSLPVIQDAINQEPLTNTEGDICIFIEEIIQITYQGYTFYRINEGLNDFPTCPVDSADRFYDCEGNFVGSIGFAPSCQSEALCMALDALTPSGTVIWSFNDGNGSNDQIFSDFPWLSDLVNPNSCSTESVEVYQSGIFSFFLVTAEDGTATLYNQDGVFYCQNSPTYDCVRAYNFGAPVEVWRCDPSCATYSGEIFYDICDDGRLFYFIEGADGQIYDPYFEPLPDFTLHEGLIVNFDYQDVTFPTPCSIADRALLLSCIEVVDTPNSEDCGLHSGTIISVACDDGSPFFFIETSTGALLDFYLPVGISFPLGDNIKVNFDYAPARFDSPCSTADQAVMITCIEAAEPSSSSSIFDDYPFLSELIDHNNCSGTSIEEYDQGGFSYLFVRTGANEGFLYYQDGTFYCSSTSTYDCLSLYNLDSPSQTWDCGDAGAVIAERRSLDNQDGLSLRAFPNPTSDVISIEIHARQLAGQELYISDALGKIVYRTSVLPNAEVVEVDLSAFQSGLYYVVLQSGGEGIVEKVIKQ